MDDLLDLSWSDSRSSASKPTLQPLSASRQPTPSTQPTFDFLAKPISGPNYYSTSAPPAPVPAPIRGDTPKTAPLPQLPRLPDSTYRSTTPNPPSTQPATDGDAFSSLFSLAGGSAAASSKTLSLADRQKQAEREKAEQAEKQRQQFEAEGSFWDNLGSSSKPPSASVSNAFAGFDDLLAPQPVRQSGLRQTHTPVPAPPSDETNAFAWDDDDTFLAGPSKPTAGSKPSSPLRSDPFNFDAFDDPSVSLAPPANARRTASSGMRTPSSDFDFGDRDDDDDLLGKLGPAPVSRATVSTTRQLPSPRQQTPPRPTSPPPHIIGQLVEMGFTPAQARSALARTDSGVNVQAALDSLLAAQAISHNDNTPQDRSSHEAEAERRRRRRAGPSRDSVKPRTAEELRSSTPGRSDSEYGEQADKIFAQASEMGQSFLKNATSFWNSSKEKAMRAYEEQRKAMEAAQDGKRREPRTDGRPRWMIEAEDRDHDQSMASGFKDSDDEDDPARVTKPLRRAQADQLAPIQPTGASDTRASYQPAGRRPPTSAHATPRTATPVRRSTPAPLPKRTLVDASPTQLHSSAAQKSLGNDHFKLGRFSEAESAYTSAIASLPIGHLFLVPLYNNRAATRLKLGQSTAAIEDCSTVIDLIGPSYHPSKEAPLPDAIASEVKLGEGLVKAVTKRAQAYEMGEKWKSALEDWERVLGYDPTLGGGSRGTASEGVRRVKAMLDGSGRDNRPVEPPRASKIPTAPVNVAKSQAVSELRKANQAAEAEDNQRAELRETVEAKILSWKGGKENNLRALIASLNTVLWPEILSGGLVVGMHELITDKQVKIKYMKVIARLHPDKLNTMTTTVEQKMLANSVFHELNTAWSRLNGS